MLLEACNKLLFFSFFTIELEIIFDIKLVSLRLKFEFRLRSRFSLRFGIKTRQRSLE